MITLRFILRSFLIGVASSLLLASALAAIPALLNHQGRVAVNGVAFEGTGLFKFALVNGDATITYWSNDGTSVGGSEPTAQVSLPVSKGLYGVLLGDTTLANMTALPPSIFANEDVRLRVWFNDGALGFEQITPDQRLAASPWAFAAGTAATVPDGAITAAKIAPGAVGGAQLTPGLLPVPVTIAGITQAAVANTSYLTTHEDPTAIQLPTTANVGDVVQVTGARGGAWSAVNPNAWAVRESKRLWRSVASSADGRNLVAAVWDGQIYTSTDFGVSWTPRESNRNWYSVASSADGIKLVAVEYDGQIYTSTDAGVNWTPRESNRGWFSVASSGDGMKLVAAVRGGQIYTSADSGASWTPRESDRRWVSVASSADGTKLVALDGDVNGQIHTSTDSGLSWTAEEVTLPNFSGWRSVASSASGTKLVALVLDDAGSQIHTSERTTTFPSGGRGATATLQYFGNGVWAPVGESQIATGAVAARNSAPISPWAAPPRAPSPAMARA